MSSKVALLIPHYNNFEGLVKSIDSIDQEENIDIFIIDDGSTSNFIIENEVLQAFKGRGNFFFKYFDKNQGIENVLNYGLDWIYNLNKYDFIARLDCGDRCLGKRFQIQEKFLLDNPEIMLLSANIICVDIYGNFLYNLNFPSTSAEIKKKMYVNSMFSHPCSMFPVKIIDLVGKYPTNYRAAEDYAYFFSIVNKYKTANLPMYLLEYEINPKGISHSKRTLQVRGRLRIILKYFYFGFWPIYGLLRNIIIYLMPHKLIQEIKKRR